MLFQTIDFAIFLPIVFFLYWLVFNKNIKHQNVLLVIASYYFYGFWDWRFLFLMWFSTFLDYFIGLGLSKTDNLSKRKLMLFISLAGNLSLLAYFKYLNFFIYNFSKTFQFLGIDFNPERLDIILPVGISFYTFQTLSYTIDVYRKKIEATTSFIEFAGFVSFFPQLVAGPIEQAKNLLPQFRKKRQLTYNSGVDALRQILWGLFKKVIIADQCALVANYTFNNVEILSGSELVIGAVAFMFQLYGDFSGYSDIAIGTAKLFGFKLSDNFKTPFFSRNMREFWQRWHISLNIWFQHYVYFPLGGNKVSRLKQLGNIFIVFILSGIWHGANWTFIVWGIVLAACFIPIFIYKKKLSPIVAENSIFPSWKELIQMILTTSIFGFSLIFFRSQNINKAIIYINNIFSSSIFSIPHFKPEHFALRTSILVLLFILFEWFGRKHKFPLQQISNYPKWCRYIIYYTLILLILWKGGYSSKTLDFIYFQF